MTTEKTHFWDCMSDKFQLKKNFVQATQSIRSTYCVLDVRTCQIWCASFRSGNFDLDDQDRTGPAGLLKLILEENPWNRQQSLQYNSSYRLEPFKSLGKILKAEN